MGHMIAFGMLWAIAGIVFANGEPKGSQERASGATMLVVGLTALLWAVAVLIARAIP